MALVRSRWWPSTPSRRPTSSVARYDLPRREDTEEIALRTNPACKVVMRREAIFGDAAQAVKRAFELVPDKEADPAEWQTARMICNAIQLIVEWNLEDADGNPLPLNAEVIRSLDPRDADQLLTVATIRMEGRPAQAEAPFANGSSKSSTATRSSRRRS